MTRLTRYRLIKPRGGTTSDNIQHEWGYFSWGTLMHQPRPPEATTFQEALGSMTTTSKNVWPTTLTTAISSTLYRTRPTLTKRLAPLAMFYMCCSQHVGLKVLVLASGPHKKQRRRGLTAIESYDRLSAVVLALQSVANKGSTCGIGRSGRPCSHSPQV